MKKTILCIFLCLTLCTGVMAFSVRAGDLPPIPLTTKPTRIAGDANANGKLELQDAAIITRYLAGGWGVTIDESAADVNADHQVDLKDVVLIRRYFAGGWGVTLQ